MNHLKLDTFDFLHESHPDITINTQTRDEFHISVQNEVGNGSFSRYIFHDAVFSIAKNLNQEDFLIEETIKQPAVWFHFNPVGTIFHRLDRKEQTATQASTSNILFFSRTIEYEIHKNIPNVSLVIIVSPDYFMNMVENNKDIHCRFIANSINQNHTDNILLNESIVSPGIQVILHQILSTPFHGPLNKVYIDGKVHELMALRIAQIGANLPGDSPNSQSLVLHSDDIEKIKAAKEIIIKLMEAPPTISLLSSLVGLNEFKLKHGFKLLFGTTIFGYLREYRLERAMLLIEKREMNITEIALEVGYRNPAHFADAFRQRYGINPGQLLMEKRKSFSI